MTGYKMPALWCTKRWESRMRQIPARGRENMWHLTWTKRRRHCRPGRLTRSSEPEPAKGIWRKRMGKIKFWTGMMEVFSFFVLITVIVFFAISYTTLPERIPMAFIGSGEPVEGGKIYFLITFWLGFCSYGLLFILKRFPGCELSRQNYAGKCGFTGAPGKAHAFDSDAFLHAHYPCGII